MLDKSLIRFMTFGRDATIWYFPGS